MAEPSVRVVEPGGLRAALTDTLAGGPPVAPLPLDPAERERTLTMLQLGVAVAEADAAVVVATSGSTGRPKGVVLTRTAIRASVQATHDRLGGPGDWLSALPEHYVAGLMVVARAVVAGTDCWPVHSDLRGLEAALAASTRRTYLSLVSTQLVRALRDRDRTAMLARLDAILLGGGPADPALVDRARSLGLKLITTYGMSETCGGCVYDGVPLAGVQVDIGSDGGVTVGGPTLFAGYRLAPGLTRDALVDGGFRTSDRGAWVDGRLVVLGRVDDVVISGGVNVDLAAVERTAQAWPELSGAGLVVVGVPDPEWGVRVVAVTDARAPAVTRDHLRDVLRDRVPAAALPRQLVRVGALPRTAGGKIDRQRIIATVPDQEAADLP